MRVFCCAEASGVSGEGGKGRGGGRGTSSSDRVDGALSIVATTCARHEKGYRLMILVPDYLWTRDFT